MLSFVLHQMNCPLWATHSKIMPFVCYYMGNTNILSGRWPIQKYGSWYNRVQTVMEFYIVAGKIYIRHTYTDFFWGRGTKNWVFLDYESIFEPKFNFILLKMSINLGDHLLSTFFSSISISLEKLCFCKKRAQFFIILPQIVFQDTKLYFEEVHLGTVEKF